jgi:hypothetical protein
MKFLTTLLIALFASSMAAEAKTVKCSTDNLKGNWIRFQKGNQQMKAVWTFNPDRSISCKGRQCKRLAGRPVSYTLTKRKISFKFEAGDMGETSCRIKNDVTLFVGGGAASGGFTFKKAKN